MVISSNEVRPGMAIVYEGVLYEVTDYQHVKPGKGGAFVRLKLKSVKDGRVLDRTVNAGEKMQDAEIEPHDMQYLYKDGENYVFMNAETYEQRHIAPVVLGDALNYIKENDTITMNFHGEDPVSIRLPSNVVLLVVDTPPAVRGDTVNNAMKAAKTETGFVVQVPMFVETGTKVKIDTRTGKYLERAQ
jgi:elongation factor P